MGQAFWPGACLARHSADLVGTLFQSITFMAPGEAVATSPAAGAVYADGARCCTP